MIRFFSLAHFVEIFSKLILLLATLVSSSGLAWAEWVATNASAQSSHYSDPKSLRREGALATIWELFDLRMPDEYEGNAVRSIKVQSEYDCKSERMRKLYYVLHQEQMGRGKTVHSFRADPYEWKPIPPDSIVQGAFQMACNIGQAK